MTGGWMVVWFILWLWNLQASHLTLCSCVSFLQVVGIFAGFGLLLLVASPFLLLATPFVLCCKCKFSKGDDDPLPT